MVLGTVTLRGNKVTVGVEFKDEGYGDTMIIHFPESFDTENWYHAVTIKRDLQEVPAVKGLQSSVYEYGKCR